MDLIRPNAGRAEVLGFDAQRDSIEVRRRTGYLPGDLALYDSLTVDACLDLVARRCVGASTAATARELVERLRLDGDRRVGDLSRGNYQKAGLVIALMAKPDVLVLDEPTNAPRPARAGGGRGDPARGGRRGPNRLLLLARARRGRADRAPCGDAARGAHRRRERPRRAAPPRAAPRDRDVRGGPTRLGVRAAARRAPRLARWPRRRVRDPTTPCTR